MSTVSNDRNVIVHYWPAGSSVVKVEGWLYPEFGHVALETFVDGNPELPGHKEAGGHYISFWPGACREWNAHRLGKGYCEETVSHFHSLEQDAQTYGASTGEIPLDLDVEKVHAAFQAFASRPYEWGALGSGMFRKVYERNCAGLTMHLLEAGGVKRGRFREYDLSRLAVVAATSGATLAAILFLSYRQFGSELRLKWMEREKVQKLLRANSQAPLDPTDPMLKIFKTSNPESLRQLERKAFLSQLGMIQRDMIFRGLVWVLPLGIAATGLLFNSRLWLQTITPRDVMKTIGNRAPSHIEEKSTSALEKQMTPAASTMDFADPVFIWIWKVEGTPSTRPMVSHLAIETPRDFMSYWESHVPSSSCEVTGPHFHDSPEVDQELLPGHVLQKIALTGLDVEKIEEAFFRFRRDPQRWGSLGWGIFRRSYERNSTGLSLYLLDKGGIFTYTDYNRRNHFSSSLEIIAITALLFSVVGYLSCWAPRSPLKTPQFDPNRVQLKSSALGPRRAYTSTGALLSRVQINRGITESIWISTKRSFGATLGSVTLKWLHDRFAFRTFEAGDIEFILLDAQGEMERRAISGAYTDKSSERRRGFTMAVIAISGLNSCLFLVSRKMASAGW